MLMDQNLMLSDAQSLAQVAGSYLSDKSIDLGSVTQVDSLGNSVISDIGRGIPIEILVQVLTAITSGGSATVQAQLVMADDGPLTSNLVVLQETAAIAVASLVSGYQFRLGGMVPPGISKRYLGVRYVIAVATTTAGTVSATLLAHKQSTFVG